MFHNATLFIMTLLAFNPMASLADPYEITYQGRIANSIGTPLSGSVDLEVRFFDAETGGTEKLGARFYPTVPLTAYGVFSLSLALSESESNSLLGASGDLWFEVKDVTHNTVFPRQKITAVPYAMRVPVDESSLDYSATGKLKVKGFSGSPLPLGTPSDGQVLKWQSGTWVWSNDSTGGVGAITTTDINDGTISNIDIAPTAAIAGTKVNPNFGSQNIVTTGTITGNGSGLTNLPAGPLGTSIDSTEIIDGTITDGDIAATAAISSTKISGLGTLSAMSAVGSAQITNGEILDEDIAATAAIAGSKINPDFGSQNITTTGTISGDGSGLTNLPAGSLGTSIDSSEIVDGTITNSDVSTTASISGSKINPDFGSQNIVTTGTISGDGSLLTNLPTPALGTSIDSSEIIDGTIVDADIAATAAISSSKISGLGNLATLSAVGSSEIGDGEILDADIAATAAISSSKISGLGSLSALNSVGSAQIANGAILNADIASTAAISGTKVNPNFGSQNIVTTGTISGNGSLLTNLPPSVLGTTIESSEITNGTIVNADIASTAAISSSKISGLGSLASKNSVSSSDVSNGTLTNIDISSSAAIAGTKISPNFGSQNILTSGTIESSSGGMTFPDSKTQMIASGRSYAVVRLSAHQNIPNNSATALSWGTEDADTDGYWSSGNPSRIIIPTSGFYMVGLNVAFAFNSTGMRQCDILIPGYATIVVEKKPAAGGSHCSLSTLRYFTAGQNLEARVMQDRGADLNVNAVEATHMWILRIN